MRWLLAALLLVPTALGGIVERHDATVDANARVGEATLAAGDVGMPTIGASGVDADVALVLLPALIADDILRVPSTNAAWRVHAELVSQGGWTALLEEITLILHDGALSETQVRITQLGGVVQSSGSPVDLPTGTDTQLRAVGTGTGTVSLDLVLRPDAGTSPEIRYRVDVTVG